MARINRRIARGKQGNKGRLRPLQVKCDRVVCGADGIKVAVPRLARVGAQLVLAFSEDQVPGAFNVCGAKGPAVVPAHSPPELKGKRGQIGVPRPFGRQIRLDRVDPVLRDVLSEENQVVEDGHHRILGRIERFLVDRHARRTVVLEDSEHTAAFLRRGRLDRLVRGGGRAIEADHTDRPDCRDDNRPQNKANR